MSRLLGTIVTACVAAAALLPGGVASAADPRHVSVGFQQLSTGIAAPTAIATASDGSNRVYVGEQAGRIRVRVPGGMISNPYLNIRDRVSQDGGERGLLGIAFHPKYYQNGNFFVAYNDRSGDVRLSRFHTSPGSLSVAASSESILLTVPHRSYSNHNGGSLGFGKDGYLYMGTGDGGSGGDPAGNAQNLKSLSGKILRIDVNRTCGSVRYCIPSNNPFASSSTAKHEIFFWGARNPWKISFDLRDGPIWVADVGQDAREELDTFSAGVGGKNLGWDCREGSLNTVSQYGGSYCSGKAFTPPLYEYGHSNGRCAIIGGFVYRGSQYSGTLGGVYVYADYCTGELWGIARQPNGSLVNALLHDHSQPITSFGQAPNGDLYVADSNGTLFKLTASAR